MDRKRASRNDPCPCGSGKKYKHCCLPKEIASRPPQPSPTITDLHGKPKKSPEYPIGTVALNGPDDKTTTKIAVGVIPSPTADAIIKHWVASDVTTNPKIQREIMDFFKEHGVTLISRSDRNMGCPHDEGEISRRAKNARFAPSGEGNREAISGSEVRVIRLLTPMRVRRPPWGSNGQRCHNERPKRRTRSETRQGTGRCDVRTPRRRATHRRL